MIYSKNINHFVISMKGIFLFHIIDNQYEINN